MTEFFKKITKTDIRNTLAMVWVVLSFVFLFKLLSKSIPVDNKDAVNLTIGFVLGSLGTIVNWYFGQSKTEVDIKRKENENI